MTRNVLRALRALSFVALCAASWRAWSYHKKVMDAAHADVQVLAKKGAERIDARLRSIMDMEQALADDLSSGRLSYDKIDARLEKNMKAHPELRGSSVNFLPDTWKKGVRLHVPYWVREKAGEAPHARFDPTYDYLDPVAIPWFTEMMKEPKARWFAPYYRVVSKTLGAVYAVPFYKPGTKDVVGAMTATMPLDEVRRMTEELDLGPSGYGEVTSGKGVYLYHPKNEYVLAQKSLVDLGNELKDKDRLTIAPLVARGERGVLDHSSTNTGERSWYVYEPIPSSGWSLQASFLRKDIPYDVTLLRRRLVHVVIAFIFFALLSTSLFLRVEQLDVSDLWTISIASSVVFALSVGFMWLVALNLDEHLKDGKSALTDRAELARRTEDYVKRCAARHAEAPIFVPTGVFVETARFASSSDVLVTGYVWQRYEDAATKGLDRGFVLRGAADPKIAEVYRQREGSGEVIRWSFQAMLHQDMNFGDYPLDQEILSLKLRHKDLDHNVVLLPDLGAYKILAPTSRPGLAPDFSVPGWRPLKTYFALAGVIDATTFGLTRGTVKEDFPGLEYNVVMRRNLLDAFIGNLVPILIALLLLFSLQMVVTADDKLAAFMQTTAGRVVNICVSMFFVIVFTHVSVRRNLATDELFYMEYFYFTTYLMILWVALNSMLFIRRKDWAWLQWGENLVPKLLFWPVVTGLLLAASVWTFY